MAGQVSAQKPKLKRESSKHRRKLFSRKELAILATVLTIIIGFIASIWLNPLFSPVVFPVAALFGYLAWRYQIPVEEPEPRSILGQLFRRIYHAIILPPKASCIVIYDHADGRWATWIRRQLEQEGYSTGLQECRGKFEHELGKAINNAECIIIILSPDFFSSVGSKLERINFIFTKMDQFHRQKILGVQVGESKLDVQIDVVNVVGMDGKSSCDILIGSIRHRIGSSVEPGISDISTTEFPSFPGDLPKIWNVPSRNPYFTDREDCLNNLYNLFVNIRAQTSIVTQAIIGLPGIGARQIAIEYAYRYQKHYDYVLWINITPSGKQAEDVQKIVNELAPTQNSQDSVQTIIDWLEEHNNWLLILDRCHDPDLNLDPDSQQVRTFIPKKGRGHVLLTTSKDSVSDFARPVRITGMKPEQGALFLLHRSSILDLGASFEKASKDDRNVAMQISGELGGIPFALNCAGAYIYKTHCTLSSYLRLYQERHPELVKQYRNPDNTPITCWSLSLEKVKQNNSAAIALLRFCAFLAPDAIPQSLIEQAVSDVGPTTSAIPSNDLEWLNFLMKKEHEYELNAAIQELNQFCLIDVDRADRSTRILSTYRLLQDILKDEMTDDEKRESAGRAVQALSHAFPEDIQFRYWRSCQHYLPHAMECKAYIEQLNISSQEALLLLDRVGCYLQERADYSKAEGFHKLALKIREQKLGSVHPDIAGNINRLAEIYHAQGEYAKAKPYYERAKEILEKSDIQGIDLATILNNMGRLYDDRGDYEEAEKLYLRAQHICEGLNPRHLYISVILNNLASLHFRQAKNKKQLIIQGKKAKQLYKEAGQLYKRAIVISRQTLGPDHPNTIQSLANLASVYLAQKRYGAAEKLYRQALMVSESTIGPDHPQIAARLNNLAELYREQEKYDLARPLYEKARIIYEQRLGPNHPSLANVLSNYATLLESEENHREALRLRKQAEDILKKHAQANP